MSATPAESMGLVVDVNELQPLIGDEIGRGGQAAVSTLGGRRDDEVFKRYLPHVEVDGDALDSLIVWRQGLQASDRHYLDERACWPRQRVVQNEATIGVIIKRAPPRFLELTRDGKAVLRELQRLFLVERMLKLGLEVPEPLNRLRVVGQMAELLEFLNRHQVVHGDLSMKNILWEPPVPGRAAVFLLDCDGAKIGNNPSPLPPVTTPGWTDPRITKKEIQVHDQQSDLYALTLSFYRCYYGHQGALDVQSTIVQVPQWPPVDQATLQLTTDGLSHRANRPSAAAWVAGLQTLINAIEDPMTLQNRQYRELKPVAQVKQSSAPATPGSARSMPSPNLGRFPAQIGAGSDSPWPVVLAIVGGLAAGSLVAFIVITLFLTGS